MARFVTADYTTFHRKFLEELHAHLKEAGSSLASYRIAKWLDQRGALTTSALALASRYSAPTVSRELGTLRELGFAEVEGRGRERVWHLTGRGLGFHRRQCAIVNGVSDSLLSVLPADLRRHMESGCYVTAIYLDRATVRDGLYDHSSACVEVICEVEQTFKRSLQGTGISLTEFRILLLLSEWGSAIPSDLCQALLIKKTLASEALRTLKAKGLVVEFPNRLDGRSTVLRLSERGTALNDSIADAIDAAVSGGFRKTDWGELKAWQELSAIFVSKARPNGI